jgi:hypothetical protein
MSVIKLLLLVYIQQKLGALVLSMISCSTIIILENMLNYCIENLCYVKVDPRYNVSRIHLHAILGVGNFTKVVRVCVPTAYELVRD